MSADLVFSDNVIGVVDVDGKKYAVNLFWKTFGGTSYSKEAGQEAKSLGGNLFCTIGSVQFGVGSTLIGQKRGMPSLAATITSAANGDMLGVFSVDDGYFLCAIRDQHIISGYDFFVPITRLDEIKKLFFEALADNEWANILCPGDWGIDRSNPDNTLSAFLGKTKPAGRLKPASKKRDIISWCILAVMVSVCVYGGLNYYSYLDEAARLENIRLETLKRLAAKNEEPPPPLPFEHKIKAVDAIRLCEQEILKANVFVAGWKTKAISCDGKSVTLKLNRDGGPVNWIAASLNKYGFTPNVAASEGSSAAASWKIGAVDKYDDSEKIGLRPLKEVRTYLVSHFEEMFQKAKFSSVDKTKFHQGLKMTLKTPYQPTGFLAILKPVRGLLLTSVSLDVEKMLWTLEVNFYEKLTPPPTKQRK